MTLTNSTNSEAAEQCVLKSLRFERRANFQKALKFAQKAMRMQPKQETQVLIQRLREKLQRSNASNTAPTSQEPRPTTDPEPEIIPPAGHDGGLTHFFSPIIDFFQAQWARVSPSTRPIVICIYTCIALVLLKRLIFPSPDIPIRQNQRQSNYSERQQRTRQGQQEQFEGWSFHSFGGTGMPGDIYYSSGNFSFFMPVVSMLIINVVINMIANMGRR